MAAANTDLFTAEDIKSISPRAQGSLVAALVTMQGEFADAGIDNPLVAAHFIAQIMTETGGLRRLDEDLNYSYPHNIQVFGRSRLPDAQARALANKPQPFGNWVYGSMLGNHGRATNDGWTYRGSGYIQLTGRANFRSRGSEIGLPLEEKPDLARQPQEGLQAALAYWKAAKISRAANDNDALRVRILVNGRAAQGLETSKVWFRQAWIRVFKKKASSEEAGQVVAVSPTDAGGYDGVLTESGYLPEGFEAGTDATAARSDAVKAFQRDAGLPETGTVDEDTEYELLDAWRHKPNDGEAPKPTALDEQTVSFDLSTTAKNPVEAVPVANDAEKGTGETVADKNIPPEDQNALANALGSYAEYEMGRAAVDPERYVPYSVVHDHDTRRPVENTTDFPARTIVQILFENRAGRQFLCSGTMVSADTVLTAAHCIHSGTAQGQPYLNFRVTPGRNKGSAPFGLLQGSDRLHIVWMDDLEQRRGKSEL